MSLEQPLYIYSFIVRLHATRILTSARARIIIQKLSVIYKKISDRIIHLVKLRMGINKYIGNAAFSLSIGF